MGHPRWEMLAQAMRESGGYDETRLKPSLLSRSYHAGRAVAGEDFAFTPREITYYGALLKTKSKIWMEVAQVYVSPPLRGNGILNLIFDGLITRAESHQSLLLFSRSVPVIETAKSKGFVEVAPGIFPSMEYWARAIGVEDRVPKSAFVAEKENIKAGERRLLVRCDLSSRRHYFS